MLLALAAFTPFLWAQTPVPAAVTPPKVGTIKITFVSPANVVSEQVVRANMQLHEGLEFDPTAVDRDIRTLYKTGHFEFVQIVPKERADHLAVDIEVEVTPKLRVQAVRYEGNQQLKPGGFLFSSYGKDVKTTAGAPLDEHLVNADAQAIRDYYQKSGYTHATVEPRIEKNRATGFATVVFVIGEGAKITIAEIRFTGNDHIRTKELRKQMETTPRWFFSWITGSGYLKDEQFEDDLNKLRDYYKEQGYLDVDIPTRDKVDFQNPSPTKLIITIPVKEGRQYRIGNITISGATLIPEATLRSQLLQKSGAIFTPSKIDKDTIALEDAYGTKGYISGNQPGETDVRMIRKPNLETGNIDVEYAITEGELFHVESIKVEGNTKTKSLVVIRELNLGPGDVFDSVRMKSSQQKLENTRFFDDVSLTPETTPIPGRKNLKIAVKEGKTGQVQFGAGFSSLEKASIYTELTQGNFDLFNRHSLYQGAGQKFRLRLQLGTRVSEAILAFEEPWLFERELALGFEVYSTSTNINSVLYDEVRTGGDIYLRKALFVLNKAVVEGQLTYTYEVINIHHITSTDPIILALAGEQRVSKIGLSLTRDTRDKLLNTTVGNRAQLNFEVAGTALGGTEDYYSLEARDAQFLTVSETQKQVLAIIGRLGVIDNYGISTEVPYFNRDFLGGPSDLRGFEYRSVGPKDATGTPIGGRSYGFFSLEYSFELIASSRFAIFYDAGFANAGAYDFNPAHYNADYGFGFRLLVAGAPLSLDFGFPLTTDKFNNKGMQFNFSLGTRF